MSAVSAALGQTKAARVRYCSDETNDGGGAPANAPLPEGTGNTPEDKVAPDGAERIMGMEESYEDMVIRERFEKLRKLMKQDYRDVFKARCMAMADLCKEMVSHLELGDDWCESWEAFHAITECAKTFVETDIPLFEAHREEERERKRGEY